MKTPVKWTVEDYHHMIEAGILADRRVELLEGEILEMAPEGALHRFINVTSAKYLRELLNGLAEVYEAHPVTLSNSEPETDIAVVRSPDTRYLTHHPYPEDIYWLIEIAHSTLADDLKRKQRTYALAGIEEYWVIKSEARTIIRFRQPQRDGYQVRTELDRGTISPVAFPQLQVSVERLLSR